MAAGARATPSKVLNPLSGSRLRAERIQARRPLGVALPWRLPQAKLDLLAAIRAVRDLLERYRIEVDGAARRGPIPGVLLVSDRDGELRVIQLSGNVHGV